MKTEKKPISEKVRSLVLDIVNAAMMYNETPTRKEFTGNKPTFYIELSGHTATLDVFYNESGYGENSHNVWLIDIFSLCSYVDDDGSEEKEIQKKLEEVLAHMKTIYYNWCIEENKDIYKVGCEGDIYE